MRVQMKMDASQEHQGFAPFPEWDYLLECLKVEDKQTRTGKEMAVLELAVRAGQYEGRKLWHNLTLIQVGDKGHGFTVAAFHAFGLPYDGDVDLDTQDFRGKTARAHVAVEEREWDEGGGNIKVIRSNKVVYFITGEGPFPEPAKSQSPVRERLKAKQEPVEDEVPF